MKKTRDPPARALVSQNKKKHECCSYLWMLFSSTTTQYSIAWHSTTLHNSSILKMSRMESSGKIEFRFKEGTFR
jgi:hypothetical protein